MMARTFDARSVLLVLCAALFVGAVYIYPDLRFIREAGSAYKGIAPIGFRDETLYLARMHAAGRGDQASRNFVVYEHRADPVIMPAFPEMIEAAAGKLLGLGTMETDIAATFVLPAVLFILIAIFTRGLCGSLWGGMAAGAAVLFGTHLFSRAFLLVGKVCNGVYTLPLWFVRPITPQMHFVFFLLALIFIWRAFVSGKIIPAIAGGILLGSLFYASVFYWVYVYTVLGILFVLALSGKDRVSCGRCIGMGLLGAIVSLPYWIGNARTIADPNFPLLLLRYNIAFTHRFIIPAGAVILCAALLAFRKAVIGEAGKKVFWMLFAMSLAVIVTLNQQVITGKLFKESHWTTYTGKFACIVAGIVLTTILARVLSRRFSYVRLPVRAATGCFFALLVVHALGVQENFHRKHLAGNLRAQEKAGLFGYLASSAPGAVVLPSPNDLELSELIPIYTASRLYYSEPFFCLSLIPAEETRYRMLASYRLFGYSLDQALRHPYSWDGAVFLTSDTNRDAAFREGERAKLRAGYQAMVGGDALALARKYRVEYVAAANASDGDAIGKLTAAGGKVVYDDGRYSVIQVGGSHG